MMMTGKEVVFWFTDSTGLNRIGQAIIFKLSIYDKTLKFASSDLDLFAETAEGTRSTNRALHRSTGPISEDLRSF